MKRKEQQGPEEMLYRDALCRSSRKRAKGNPSIRAKDLQLPSLLLQMGL